MSCQSNPETYAIVIRCTLKEGALLKTLAEESGKTISVLMGEKVKELVGDRDLTEVEQMWYDAHLEANIEHRKRQDERNAKGYYRHRHVGRPRKPGPRKGSKRVKTHFEPTPAPVEQPETSEVKNA